MVESPSHILLHTTLEVCDHTTNSRSVLGRLLDTSFGLSQFNGHKSWLVCEGALRLISASHIINSSVD